MSRTTAALALTALLGLGLVGCSAPASQPRSAETPDVSTSSAAPASPDATDEPDATGTAAEPDAAQAAAELCAEASQAGEGDVCVLENASASGDLTFESFRIVKIIGGAFDGGIRVTGAEQVTITEASVGGSVAVDGRGGAVVKLATIGGSLDLAGVRSATLVKNRVGGDLLCADGVQANGDGNTVTGEVTGTCSRVL